MTSVEFCHKIYMIWDIVGSVSVVLGFICVFFIKHKYISDPLKIISVLIVLDSGRHRR